MWHGEASLFSSPWVSDTLKNRNFYSLIDLELPMTYLCLSTAPSHGGWKEGVVSLTGGSKSLEPIDFCGTLKSRLCAKGHLQMWPIWGSMNLTWSKVNLDPHWGWMKKFLIHRANGPQSLDIEATIGKFVSASYPSCILWFYLLWVGKPVFWFVCGFWEYLLFDSASSQRSRMEQKLVSSLINRAWFVLSLYKTYYGSLVCEMAVVGFKQD